MFDQDQTYLLQSYNENESLFANVERQFNHKKSQKCLTNRQNSKKTIIMHTLPQADTYQSHKMSNVMDMSYDFGLKSRKYQQDPWCNNADINVKMLDSIWQDRQAEDERTASKNALNYITKKYQKSNKQIGHIKQLTINNKQRKRSDATHNTVVLEGRGINFSKYIPDNKVRSSSQNPFTKQKYGQNISKIGNIQQNNYKIGKKQQIWSTRQQKQQKQNKKQPITNILKPNQHTNNNKNNHKQQIKQIQKQFKTAFSVQMDQFQDNTTKKIKKLTKYIQQFYQQHQYNTNKVKQYQKTIHNLKQILTQQKQAYQLQIQQHQSKNKRLQSIISQLHTHYTQQLITYKNTIKNINNLLQIKRFQITNLIHYHIVNYKQQLSNYYANCYAHPSQDNQKMYTCNSKANLIAQYGMINVSINNTKSVPILSYQPTQQVHTTKNNNREQHKVQQKIQIKQIVQNIHNNIDGFNQLPSITLSAIVPKLSTILQNSNQLTKQSLLLHRQKQKQKQKQVEVQVNENFRKLTTFRIKQLQKQNSYLQNQLNTNNIKIMIIQNQNKQLKEIVEGMILQMKKLGIYPTSNTTHNNDINCTFAYQQTHRSNHYQSYTHYL